ncbi:Rab geranylgeranyltransferase [Steccherinum ochraceum]|uniref:Geranylgeranyl transferase type-2 subunit alpha n=1 Tax=Steccherinum ochraceum TaxID=92696 RepID=A0A4R0RCU3_9APHY|nr:Rab geranylgeranyltransferase [Steccherinum ochraceum]
MHNVKRVQYSKEVLEARKQRDQARLKQYLALYDRVFDKRKNADFSQEAFNSTTSLLRINSELYTIWNYRRNIMTNGIFPSSEPSKVNSMLNDDLELTFELLKQHPKIYWIWTHRRWCLEHVPDGPTDDDPKGWKTANWKKELFVVEKMLNADARNFHAWNYRRYILASMDNPPPQTSELAYTTKKIEANFSNFSAWHQRSKVLQSLWDEGKIDERSSREADFELVRNAMYTDPDDQSVWMYHAWLIGSGNDLPLLRREIQSIQELLDEQPDSKWCMESIVRYKKLILRNHASSLSAEEQEKLRSDCSSLLVTLEDIDPLRRQRYRHMKQELLA